MDRDLVESASEFTIKVIKPMKIPGMGGVGNERNTVV